MNKSERTNLQTLDQAIERQEEQFKNATERGSSPEDLTKINHAKGDLQRQKEELIQQLRTKYPGYYTLWDQLKHDEGHVSMMVTMCQLMPDEEHSATNLEMCEEQLAEVVKKIADLDSEFERTPEKFLG